MIRCWRCGGKVEWDYDTSDKRVGNCVVCDAICIKTLPPADLAPADLTQTGPNAKR